MYEALKPVTNDIYATAVLPGDQTYEATLAPQFNEVSARKQSSHRYLNFEFFYSRTVRVAFNYSESPLLPVAISVFNPRRIHILCSSPTL